jgi:hypothetical protein
MAKAVIIRLERERPRFDRKGKPEAPRFDTDHLANDLTPIITPLVQTRFGKDVEVIVQPYSAGSITVRGWKEEKTTKEELGALLEEAYESIEMEKYELAPR